MAGLILNDFLLIEKSFKFNCFLTLIALLFYVIVQNPLILLLFVFMECLMIPCSSFNGINMMRSSNWNMIMDGFPIKRKKIILSKYILFITMSVFSSLITVLLLYFLPTDKIIIGDMAFNAKQLLIMYCVEAQLICILYYPLVYKLKSEKIDSVIMMAIGGSFTILFLIKNLSWSIIFLLIFLGYIVSYVITCWFDKKEDQ